jgi:predicted O-methyltransferase YrrM
MFFHAGIIDGKNHFEFFESHKHGPIQKDEAFFLYSIVKMTRPSTIVEFGLQTGISAYNFCVAKDEDCFYFGLDKDYNCVEKTKIICNKFKNTFFIYDDCLNFNLSMIENKKIDLFFLDCSHDFELNKICLDKITPNLSKNGIIIIHDTGNYSKEGFEKSPEKYKNQNKILGDKIKKMGRTPVIKAEQNTVNWFMQKHKDFGTIHFNTEKIMRNGMTLMQKKSYLI